MREKNYEQYKRLFRFAEALVVMNIVGISFALTWYEILNPLMNEKRDAFNNKGNLLMIAVYLALAWVFIKVFGGIEVGF